jgi:hypothetical protein
MPTGRRGIGKLSSLASACRFCDANIRWTTTIWQDAYFALIQFANRDDGRGRKWLPLADWCFVGFLKYDDVLPRKDL